jgi:ATP-dependent RNA helicase RhlE
VLVATDIAARGIDVDDVSHVFNYDLPNEHETFVHRIGRTARAGKDGVAISFCSPDEESDLRAIEKLTRVKIPEGDQSVYDKLPPPQKETAESIMRNSRGRMSREEAQARAAETREKHGRRGDHGNRKDSRNENRETAQNVPHDNASNPSQMPNGGRHRRRNRPGSRARRRMREAQSQG